MTNRTPVALAFGFAHALALTALMAIPGPTLAQSPKEEPVGQPRTLTEAPAAQQAAYFEENVIAGADWAECAPACDACSRFWFTGDISVGWIEGGHLPPLVTTSPPGTPQAAAGVFGQPGTSTVLGDNNYNDDLRWGLSLGGGYWLDAAHIWGVEIGFEVFESQATNLAVGSGGTPILARPFFNTLSNALDSVVVAFPGAASGDVSIRTTSGNFYEGHLDITENFYNCGCLRLDALLGYRFYRYDESLVMGQNIFPTGTNFAAGTRIATVDNFNTQNEFHGGDIGIEAKYSMGDLSLGLLAKAAVGNIHQEVDIHGSQTVTAPGTAPVTSPGGIYALPTNSGKHGSDDWTFMPEVGGTVSWQFGSHVQLSMGYSVLYMEKIARPADQIDFNLNPNLFPPAVNPLTGPNTPAFSLEHADAWLQKVSFGIEFRF